MTEHKQPYRIVEGTTSDLIYQLWHMPISNTYYSIVFIHNIWRVQEAYIENDKIYLKGNYPFKDYLSLIDALKHIEFNHKIDIQNFEVKAQ